MVRHIQPKVSHSTPIFWFVTLVLIGASVLMATLDSASTLEIVIPLVVASFIGVLTFAAGSIVAYELDGQTLVVRHWWVTRRFSLAEFALDIVQVNSLLRGAGIGLDNYNYGWYVVNGESVFAIATHIGLGSSVVVIRERDKGRARYLFTPADLFGFKHPAD